MFADGSVWIAKTVLLETEWVLRSFYGLDAEAVRGAFTSVLGLRNVHAEDEGSVATELALTEHRIEFADPLHLSSRTRGARFASFNRALIRRAKRAGVGEVSGLVQ